MVFKNRKPILLIWKQTPFQKVLVHCAAAEWTIHLKLTCAHCYFEVELCTVFYSFREVSFAGHQLQLPKWVILSSGSWPSFVPISCCPCATQNASSSYTLNLQVSSNPEHYTHVSLTNMGIPVWRSIFLLVYQRHFLMRTSMDCLLKTKKCIMLANKLYWIHKVNLSEHKKTTLFFPAVKLIFSVESYTLKNYLTGEPSVYFQFLEIIQKWLQKFN